MPFVPSRRLALLFALPLGFALTALADPTLLWPMLALDAAIVFVALGDAFAGRRSPVTATRTLPRVMSVGRDNAGQIAVHNRRTRPLVVQLRNDLPDWVDGATPIVVQAPARGHVGVTFHLRPNQRGSFTVGDVHIRHLTPLGLWLRQSRVPLATEVRVYPDLQAVRTYELLARQNRDALLARAARLKGGENEFERLREMTRDDTFRSVDWKATARKQKLIAREYQKERDQTVMCLLDCGRLMTAESGGLSYLDHALNATLMMAHVAARSGDQVGLLAFNRTVMAYVPPAGGPQATQRLVATAYDLQASLVETDFTVAFDLLARRLPKRALVVLFTQVVDDVAAAALAHRVRGLPRRHLPLCVMFREGDVDARLAHPPSAGSPSADDPYVQAAAAEHVLWRERWVRTLKAGGADVIDPLPAQMTPALVNRYLEIKAQQRL